MKQKTKMRRPTQPAEPTKPHIPDPPSPVIVTYENVTLMTLLKSYGHNCPKMTVADWSIAIRDALSKNSFSPKTLITFETQVFGYEGEEHETTLVAPVPTESPNPKYEAELKAYNKNKPHYEKLILDYEIKCEAYKTKLEAYIIAKKEYDALAQKHEIAHLEARLAELKKKVVEPKTVTAFAQEWIERDRWSGPSPGGWTVAITEAALNEYIADEYNSRSLSKEVPDEYSSAEGPIVQIQIEKELFDKILKSDKGIVWLDSLPKKE